MVFNASLYFERALVLLEDNVGTVKIYLRVLTVHQ